MGAAKILHTITLEEYLGSEMASPVRREYVRGEVYAMAGTTINHNRIVRRLLELLSPAAQQKNCEVLFQDIKLKIPLSSRAGTFSEVVYYPDLMVVCGPINPKSHFVDGACLIVEILSPSTAQTDKREKKENYLTLDSLEAYLLVDSESRLVEGYFRTPEGWAKKSWSQGEVELPCPGATLNLEGLYQGIL